MKITSLDRAITWLSPEAGLRRLAARAAFDRAAETLRGYDAAQSNRRTDGWVTGNGSANAELGRYASRIRSRSRDLVRNNGYAATAVRKLAAHMVGTGWTPRLKTADKAARSSFLDDWNAFSENCDVAGHLDFPGLCLLAARTIPESGEVLIRKIPQPASSKLRVPLKIQVLEPDYLDSSRTVRLNDGGAIIQGVEYDKTGRRCAYWLFNEHPGETLASFRGGLISERVDARYIQHVFDPLRPGQARGVSWFAPVTIKLHDMGDYDEAELVRKKIEACFAVFVKAQEDSNGTLGATRTEGSGSTAKRIETMSPAMVQYLNPGEEVTFGAPAAGGTEFAQYMSVQLHAIAAGVGITYEQLTGDLQGVNYSSIREGKIDFWQMLDVWQWIMLAPMLMRPIARDVMSLRAVMGRQGAPDLPLEWATPKRPWVDPKNDIDATRDGIRSGLQSWRDAVAERGGDPDDVLAEIADTNKAFDAAGIVLDIDPRLVNVKGAKLTSEGGAAAGDAGNAGN